MDVLLVVCVSTAVKCTTYNETRVELNSRWDLMHHKDECRHQKWVAKDDATNAGNPDDWQDYYSPECRYIDNFTLSKLSVEEVFRWIYWSDGESGAVRMLTNPQHGLSASALKTLILNMTNVGHGLSERKLGAFATIGETYFKRLGILHNLTVADVTEFGPHFLYLLPAHFYGTMSDALFDHVLHLHDVEADKKRIYYDLKDAFAANGTHFNKTEDFFYGITYGHLVWVDPPRLRALCRRAFTQYKNFNNLSTSDLDKIRYHMQCAPPSECSNLPIDWVQNNVDLLASLPFNCHYKRDTDEWFRRSSAIYSTGNLCGRYVAKKSLENGTNPIVLSSQEDIIRMKGLILCIPDSYARTAIDMAGCDMAKDAAMKGFLKPSFVTYTFGNCIQLPSDMSTVNCSYIASTFGAYFSEMKMSFYESIPNNILCDGECLTTFKGAADFPSSVKKYLTRTCFSGQGAVIDSTAVDNLGAMVTDLAPDQFQQIGAADLERNIEDIKKDMQSAGVERNHQRHAVISQIGEKMVGSGKISAIADSKEIMKEVSINKLRSGVSNLEQDFGLNDPNVSLATTDSQNKWIMEEVKKNKRPSNFSASEIRAMSSAVTGFLRSDIEEIATYQNNQSSPRHMQIAKALCEQPHWPFGPLNAINRLLIKKSLELLNDSQPFAFLSEADAEQLHCECMMDFHNGAQIDETSLRLLGSAIMLFPQATQQQMDKATIANLAREMMDTINPRDDNNIELLDCCYKWLSDDDKLALKNLKKTLMITIRDAVIWKMQNARRKRSVVQWTCDDIRIVGEAFTTVSDAEINAMTTEEFTECLSDIGLLDGWNETQKAVLLQKAVDSLNMTVCDMTGTDIGQLGIIAQAMDITDLQCLPLNESDVVTSLGSFSGWNETQLDAIADGYMTANAINNLTSLTVSEVAVLGEVMCGFNPTEMATMPVAVVAGSGTQLGRLEDCDQAQYAALKTLTLDDSAYGPVGNWSAADVTELNNLLIGLTSQEIPALTTDAIEGLTADVISKLPPTVFAAMTDSQLNSLISDQVALLTDDQKSQLSAGQTEILSNITQGFISGDGGNNNGGDGGDTPSHAVPLTTTAIWITVAGLLMFIAS